MPGNVNDRNLKLLGWLFHAGGLLSLVVGGCAHHFIVSAVITRYERVNRDEIAKHEDLLATAGDVRREHGRLIAALSELEQRAETMRQKIPDLPHEADFLNQVAEAARARGLAIRNYTRGNVQAKSTHSELEIRLSGEGDYASICGFFEEIAALPRVATVRSMNLSVPQGSEIYPLDMTLTLYFGARAPENEGGTRG